MFGRKALLTLPIAALLLAGCGGTPASSPTAPTVEPIARSSATPAAAESSKSPRGNIVKGFGQGASITDSTNDNREIVNFAVNSIVPVTCTEQYAQPETNGHLVVVDVAVETKPELAEAIMKSYHLGGGDFKFVAENGTTFNGNLFTGGVLDVPAPTGILVLKAPFSTTNGWEYKF